MKSNWLSTLIGVAVAAAYLGYKMYKGLPITLDEWFIAAGFAGLGGVTKDFNSHSTQAEVAEATQKAVNKAVAPGDVAVPDRPDPKL